jgi:hypothetical protein
MSAKKNRQANATAYKNHFIIGKITTSFIKLRVKNSTVLIKKSNNNTRKVSIPFSVKLRLNNNQFFVVGSNKSSLFTFL